MKSSTRKFSRKSPEKALLSGLAQSLILKERIRTTQMRGKEAARLAERLISRGKKGDLAAQRELRKHLSDSAARKVVKELAPRYRERAGGCTRVVKLGQRSSDGAELVFVELINEHAQS